MMRKELSLAATTYHQRESSEFQRAKGRPTHLHGNRISVLFQKQSTFSYTAYLEECCQSLQNGKEYSHDMYMTALVQLQYIGEKIDRLSAEPRQGLMRPGSGSELYIKSIRTDLESFQDRLPFNIYDARTSHSISGSESFLANCS